MPASHNTGVTGKTTIGTGMFYSPYMPSDVTMLGAFYGKAKWKLKFALWPRRCAISNKWIWMKRGYEGTAIWTGPGDPVFEYNWHSIDTHMIYELKR